MTTGALGRGGFWIATVWPCLVAFFAGGLSLGLLRGWLAERGRAQVGNFARVKKAVNRSVGEDAAGSRQFRGAATGLAATEADSAAILAIGLDPALAQTSYPIEEIEGIGPAFGRAMRAMGLADTDQFLARVTSQEDREAVAAGIDHDDVDARVVERWRNMADLCRIKGVRGQFAELLEFAGVSSREQLAEKDARSLFEAVRDLNQRENRSHELPHRQWIDDWIRQVRGESSRLVFAEISEEEARAGYRIEEIEGIGPGYGRRLRAIGIQTTLDLLGRGREPDSRTAIARAMARPEVDESVVGRWISMAELMQVEGIMGQSAELLHFSGIESLRQLGNCQADRLLSELKDTNERENRVPQVPSLPQIEGWIGRARRFATPER